MRGWLILREYPRTIKFAGNFPLFPASHWTCQPGTLTLHAGEVAEGEAMTEAEWLACDDPAPMLEDLQSRVSRRRLRLFACACCRRIWHLLEDEGSWKAVEVAEQYADRLVSNKERAAAVALAGTLPAMLAAGPTIKLVFGDALECSQHAASEVASAAARNPEVPDTCRENAYEVEMRMQCRLFRCIFGNPFRPVSLDPTWRTPTVTALATAAYEERILPTGILEADRIAVLADALEDVGCDNAYILSHLRGPGPHVRGCWAIDLLLKKE